MRAQVAMAPRCAISSSRCCQLAAVALGAEQLVLIAARAGGGRRGELVRGLGIVQRVIEARDRARGVAEGGVRGHVDYALAVDVDLAPIAQAGEVFRAGERPAARADGVLGLAATHGTAPSARATAAARHSRRRVST